MVNNRIILSQYLLPYNTYLELEFRSIYVTYLSKFLQLQLNYSCQEGMPNRNTHRFAVLSAHSTIWRSCIISDIIPVHTFNPWLHLAPPGGCAAQSANKLSELLMRSPKVIIDLITHQSDGKWKQRQWRSWKAKREEIPRQRMRPRRRRVYWLTSK